MKDKKLKPIVKATQSPRGKLSGAAVARLAGVSKQAACKALRAGKSAGEIILAAELRRAGPQSDAATADADGKSLPSLSQLQRRKLKLSNDLATLELARRRGESLDTASVQACYLSAIVQTRDALLALPSILRDRCDDRPGAEIEALWDRELREVLMTFAGKLTLSAERGGEIAEFWREFKEWKKERRECGK